MPKKILLIEDDPLMSELYDNILTLEHFEVVIAKDGEDGLIQVKTSQPDLILLDIMMPKMDGFQVLDSLKSNPDTRDIPVIMLTNLMDQEKAEESLKNGAERYIVKSDHNPDEVIQIINEVLAQPPVKSPQAT